MYKLKYKNVSDIHLYKTEFKVVKTRGKLYFIN